MMTKQELDFMIDFTHAYERRWRDVKKRSHCLSVEYRYDNGTKQSHTANPGGSRYGEDAMVLAMWAWRDIPRGTPDLQEALRVSFGIGAKSQDDYEKRLEDVIGQIGLQELHRRTDLGLRKWLEAMKMRAGKDFELLFEKI